MLRVAVGLGLEFYNTYLDGDFSWRDIETPAILMMYWAEASAGKARAAQCEDWNSDPSTDIKPRACGSPLAIQEFRQTR